MTQKDPLTPEEERRCLHALRLLGIEDPNHPVLSDRGYFALFLNGLSPEEMGHDIHPSMAEFRELRSLMVRAGTIRLRRILAEQTRWRLRRLQAQEDVLRRNSRPLDAALEELEQPPPATAPSHPPQSPRRTSSSTVVIPPPDPEANNPARQEMRQRPTAGLSSTRSPEIVAARVQKLMEKDDFQEAYRVGSDYLSKYAIQETVLNATLAVLARAGEGNHGLGKIPFTMLYECEELAAILGRQIPHASSLSEHGDSQNARAFRMFLHTYHTWVEHGRALTLYRYTTKEGEFIHRPHLDTQELGFLLDVLRSAARDSLPVSLVQDIYKGCRRCLELGLEVLPDKRAGGRFEAAMLQVLLAPLQRYPDVAAEVLHDAVDAYLRADMIPQAREALETGLRLRPAHRGLNELRAKGGLGGY